MAQDRRLPLIGLLFAAATGAAGCLCTQISELDPSLLDGGGQVDGGCHLDNDCADDIDCTQDLCADDGNCRHFADDTICADDEICFPEIGCVPRHPCETVEDCQDDNVCNGEESCVDNICRPGESFECDDGDFCNGVETCDAAQGCEAGEPPSCSDGIDCTVDACADGACTHTTDDSICADGKACNGSEVCDPVRGCQSGSRACDDGVDCTEDECVEPAGTCLHHANHLLCGPGQICDGTGCLQQQCADASDCDDQDSCNGVETCNADGVCESGDRVVCDDGVFCNGTEYCEDGSCVSQDPPACADGIACTTDTCDLVSDECIHVPNHASCADAAFCNGDEQCGALGCAAGSPPDCDDGDACTVESCVEGDGCSSEARDRDADGSGDAACGGDDCNDLDPFSHPGAAEICNELDDDCDGTIDEGFDCRQGASGSCTTACGTTGSRTCTAQCAWDACSPPPEDCNGRDDDCDGQTDEGCQCSPQDPTTCRTECGTNGSRSCVNGAWTVCTPPAEVCNGIDDDCRGGVDDGFACSPAAIRTCTTACGTTGTQTCGANCTWGSCAPPREVCNGVDDDCEGGVDEDFACSVGAVGTCTTVCGSTGSRTCGNACSWGACTPPAESCNGVDDDCDAACDETFACCAGTAITQCRTACNTLGADACSNACAPAAGCAAPQETCNGRDDDCDGQCDDGVGSCCAGERRQCVIAGDMNGTQICGQDCAWGACCAARERCGNGVDDDCDGTVDEGDCCNLGGADGCNGIDNDCDGICDDDVECCKHAVEPCLTTCNTVGSRRCAGNCRWDACVPPAELCNNGIDDDCDGLVDALDDGC